MIEVKLATGFDTTTRTEEYEVAKLTAEEAAKVLQQILCKLDYKQAKAWIDSHKK